MTEFPPTRTEALRRLNAFVPKAGRDYAAKRNYDLPGHPHVSGLSPYIRHRLITEDEVLSAVLARFAPSTAEKFVQEVFWRTYWKGWLEMRPGVWRVYQGSLNGALNRVQTEAGLRTRWEEACGGMTGIDCFDHWAQELAETGYLHNHARMWFASIWCFTLRLPWQLGADFFLRHLLDGDPASNTLGWRWVAGLQTPGKTYTATASNIARYTEGRFNPLHQLTPVTAPVEGLPNPPHSDPPQSGAWDPGKRTGLLLTEDDLSPGFLFAQGLRPAATAVLLGTGARSPLTVSPHVVAFTTAAAEDAVARFSDRLGPVTSPTEDPVAIAAWAGENGLDQIVLPYAPVGPAADRIAALADLTEVPVIQVLRPSDQRAWPQATHGFYRFKENIPRLIADLKGLKAA
ncbi:MAG: FAD-binding domain-containing protein [Rhodobacter sp.]|nr:FAD-binding domain-containing protein [Rhodobacter sp.]